MDDNSSSSETDLEDSIDFNNSDIKIFDKFPSPKLISRSKIKQQYEFYNFIKNDCKEIEINSSEIPWYKKDTTLIQILTSHECILRKFFENPNNFETDEEIIFSIIDILVPNLITNKIQKQNKSIRLLRPEIYKIALIDEKNFDIYHRTISFQRTSKNVYFIFKYMFKTLKIDHLDQNFFPSCIYYDDGAFLNILLEYNVNCQIDIISDEIIIACFFLIIHKLFYVNFSSKFCLSNLLRCFYKLLDISKLDDNVYGTFIEHFIIYVDWNLCLTQDQKNKFIPSILFTMIRKILNKMNTSISLEYSNPKRTNMIDSIVGAGRYDILLLFIKKHFDLENWLKELKNKQDFPIFQNSKYVYVYSPSLSYDDIKNKIVDKIFINMKWEKTRFLFLNENRKFYYFARFPGDIINVIFNYSKNHFDEKIFDKYDPTKQT